MSPECIQAELTKVLPITMMMMMMKLNDDDLSISHQNVSVQYISVNLFSLYFRFVAAANDGKLLIF